MMKGMGNMKGMMKQAQKLQKKMAKIQEEAASKTVEATEPGSSPFRGFLAGNGQLVDGLRGLLIRSG